MQPSAYRLSLLLVASSGSASAARAEEPAKAFTVSGGASLVTDYRFRGLSQTDRNAAAQATATIAHASGFYVTFWGSSVSAYVTASGRSHQELDLIAGYKRSFAGTTLDVGLLYYVYPGTRLPGDRTASNFAEPYASVSRALGPVTVKATVNYAPKQKALALDQLGPKRDNLYLAADLTAPIPKTPFALAAHLGHTLGPSWLAVGRRYTDWNVGGTFAWRVLTLGLQYVDTDVRLTTPWGRNAAGAGVVGSLGVSF
jgi:uncharacterized protein (TIGR02001 family)